MDVRLEARDEVRKYFRWRGGHADLTAIFRSSRTLALLGPAPSQPFEDAHVDAACAIEARGFVIGTLVASSLKVGLVLARKSGSVHPGAITRMPDYPDWRQRSIETGISASSVTQGDRVLLVDDWIETGSQASNAAELLSSMGAVVVGATVIVDDTTDDVRQRLGVASLLSRDDLPTFDN